MPVYIDNAEDFLLEARQRFKFGCDADAIDRNEALSDNRFANAEDSGLGQWDAEILEARRKANRPVQQWNVIPTFVQHVVNEGRQNKPAIKISQDDTGTKETAEFFQSRIRQIEYDSDADIAYDTAREQQVTSGRGALRILTEYAPGTRKQRIRIKRIENQFSVVWDPSAVEYDRADADWCFVISLISQDEHRRKYGKDSIVSQADFLRSDHGLPIDWVGVGKDGKMIQIAEYWVKEHHGPGQKPTICCYEINGAEVLGKHLWAGSRIPIIPQWGREAVVDGVKRTFSLIRNSKEPQRMVNFYVSNIAEQIGQQTKAPYKVAIGQIPAHLENDWKEATTVPKGYLLYNRFDEQGRDLGVPQREPIEPQIQALSIGLQQAIEGVKASMGIYDARIGKASNETSGIAIERRRQESEIVNFHFTDNEERTRKTVGEVLIEMIPLVDEPGTFVPIRSEDGKTRVVPIGQPYRDPKSGQEVTHNLTEGHYGVAVSSGPSYTSQRQEAYEKDAALITADPQLLWVIGDQLFANDDTAGAEERAERMKRAIQMRTPGLIQDEEENAVPIPPQVQQQIVSLEKELLATQQFAQSLQEQLSTKKPELDNAVKLKQMDLDYKREELGTKTELAIQLEAFKAGVTADMGELKAQLDMLKSERALEAQKQQARDTMAHETEESNKARSQEIEMAQFQAEHASEESDKSREQEMALAEAAKAQV